MDIVTFTKFCSVSTPMQIISMLNELFSTFDALVEAHDVYKVETIGDAYMCVSGVPNRNGMNHVLQIALVTLGFIDVRTDNCSFRTYCLGCQIHQSRPHGPVIPSTNPWWNAYGSSGHRGHWSACTQVLFVWGHCELWLSYNYCNGCR